MRVFVDAAVLFSASRRGSLMEQFIRKVLTVAEGVTNAHAVEEARRNLALKFPESVAQLSKLITRMELVAHVVAFRDRALPAKDQPILGGAIAGRCTHLLTSDRRDFGRLFGKTVQGVKVVSPQMLAEELLARAGN